MMVFSGCEEFMTELSSKPIQLHQRVGGWREGRSWVLPRLLLLGLVEDVRQATLAAVLPVVVGGHEDAGAALLGGTLAPQAVDLPVVVDLVVLEHSELDLLLPLLTTTPEPEHKVEGGLLLDVVVGQGPAILQLLAGEDQPLLVRGDSLLVLDLSLDIFDGI